MGGERRRRRLRHSRDTNEPAPESEPDGEQPAPDNRTSDTPPGGTPQTGGTPQGVSLGSGDVGTHGASRPTPADPPVFAEAGRRRRRPVGRTTRRAGPSPADLAGLSGAFAMTAGGQDPESDAQPPSDRSPTDRGPTDRSTSDRGPTDRSTSDRGPTDRGTSDRGPTDRSLEKAPSADHRFDDPVGERGLRGLVGGGSSQVDVTAAMRARDAARPTDADLATADVELPIIRRGWVPRDDLPRNP